VKSSLIWVKFSRGRRHCIARLDSGLKGQRGEPRCFNWRILEPKRLRAQKWDCQFRMGIKSLTRFLCFGVWELVVLFRSRRDVVEAIHRASENNCIQWCLLGLYVNSCSCLTNFTIDVTKGVRGWLRKISEPGYFSESLAKMGMILWYNSLVRIKDDQIDR